MNLNNILGYLESMAIQSKDNDYNQLSADITAARRLLERSFDYWRVKHSKDAEEMDIAISQDFGLG